MIKYNINDDIEIVNGIGKVRKHIFNINNIFIINDLLKFFPKEYEYLEKIYFINELYLIQKKGYINCKVISITKQKFKEKYIYKIIASDGNNSVEIICFYNINNYIKINYTYLFFGKIKLYKNIYYLIGPIIKNLNDINFLNIIPKYKCKISNSLIQKIIIHIINNLDCCDIIPIEILLYNKLPNIKETFRMIHCPKNNNEIIIAQKKFLSEKIFNYCKQKIENFISKSNEKNEILLKEFDIDEYIHKLNFKLTNEQLSIINKMIFTLKKNKIIYELIQGEVGSGKTVVALAIAYLIAKNNYQVVIMVPTEILAFQYYNNNVCIFKSLNIEICLLSKSKSKNIKQICDQIENGYYKIIIGTHILLNKNINFNLLGLIIIDEQHKFGVQQRQKIINKSKKYYPNIIIMTATPIPRTLALTYYTNFSYSNMINKPFKSITHTLFILEDKINNLLKFIERKILLHQEQVYILCPTILSNISKNSVYNIYNYIKQKLNFKINISVYHSKQSEIDKINIINNFKINKIQVLITTTIIEVGLDISNATILLIYSPERFGLSQLHQIRGRIGRNNKKNNYCFLIIKNNNQKKSRLMILQKTNDAFLISKYDMQLRGIGNLFGNSQHGIKFKEDNNIFFKKIYNQIINYFYKNITNYNIKISEFQKQNLLFFDN